MTPENRSMWRAVGVFWLTIICYGLIALSERFVK